jgi:predicted transcriptional regulator
VEAVERMVDHNAWFAAEVEKGLAELERGQVLSHEELGRRIEERLTQRRTA